MENITEWAGKIDKGRDKPSQQLQKELFNRVITALKENTNTYEECVAAFCHFNPKVIPPFYQDYYWTDVPDRAKWDDAFLSWANSKKPTVPATIRMALILQEKLRKAESSADVLSELQWFSLHEDARSASVFKGLCKNENSKYSDLRKLLDLDMRDWKIGQPLIIKMYGILFSDALESKTQELYREFLARNGLIENASAVSETLSEQKMIPSSDNQNESEKESAYQSNSLAAITVVTPTAPVHSMKVERMSEQDVAIVDKAIPKIADIPKDGIALAETMLKWARSQTERQVDLDIRLSNSLSELSQLGKQNEEMKAQITALESNLLLLKKEKETLELQLVEAKETSAVLEAEKKAAQDTIGRVQIMSDNSVKQEIDGFKHDLASALSRTVKDFGSDVSDLTDAEKVEVYVALMDELLDTLRHNGIVIEEN